MKQLPVLRRPRVAVPVILALAALALSGCGGGTQTNGLEKLSAGEVQRKAAAALGSAKSAHVKGTGVFQGYPVQIDLRISGTSVSGAVAAEGVRVEITKIGADHLRQGKRAGPEEARRLRRCGARRCGPLAQACSEAGHAVEGFSLTELAGQLVHDDSPLDPQVTQATLDGQQVVVLTQQNGSKLYVANSGRAYPLRGNYNGPAPGRIDFTEYGTDVRITAPENAIDVAKRP